MELGSVTKWANKNPGLIALFGVMITILIAGIQHKLRRKQVVHQNMQKELEKTERWRKEFSDYLDRIRAENIQHDIPLIIRDVKRKSQYPKTCHGKGASSSFKVWLVDTYHNGIMVSFGTLQITYIKAIEDNTNWFFCKSDDPEGRKVFLIGKIPFHRIENVNWKGDEYSGYDPHVFCRFDSKDREPYEELVYAESIDRPNSWPYLHEIVRFQDMRNERIC